jgi:hypothetical protein
MPRHGHLPIHNSGRTRLIIRPTLHWCFVFNIWSFSRSFRFRVAPGIIMRTRWSWLTFGWTWGPRAWNDTVLPVIFQHVLYIMMLSASKDYILPNGSMIGNNSKESYRILTGVKSMHFQGRTENNHSQDNWWNKRLSNTSLEYVGVLISLWFFLFSYLQHNQKNFSWMG